MRKPVFLLSFWLFLSLCAPLRADAQQPEVLDWSAMLQEMDKSEDSLVVVNFWATWCRPCVAELPFFRQAEAEFADQRVRFLYVSLDFPEEMENRILPFLQAKEMNERVFVLDEPNANKFIDRVSPEWGGSIPATLYYRPGTGRVEFHEGDYTFESLRAQLETLLQNP